MRDRLLDQSPVLPETGRTRVERRCCFEARLSHKSGAAALIANATQSEPF
jgi:hypothetical protein